MAFLDFVGLCSGDRSDRKTASSKQPSKSIFNCSSGRSFSDDEDESDSPPRRKIKGQANFLRDGSLAPIPESRKMSNKPKINRSQSARDPPRTRRKSKTMKRQNSELIRTRKSPRSKLKTQEPKKELKTQEPKSDSLPKTEIPQSEDLSSSYLSSSSRTQPEISRSESPQSETPGFPKMTRDSSLSRVSSLSTTSLSRGSSLSKGSLVTAPDAKLGDDQVIDRWGKVTSKPVSAAELSEKEKQKIVQRETERETKWLQMIKEWDRKPGHPVSHPKLKERIRKGVSDSVRGTVWARLAEANQAFESDRMLYPKLLKEKLPREHEIQIRKDLPRSFQGHIMFRSPVPGSRSIISKGQARLYNVLKAYAIFDKEVGYVQGMGDIAGLCLMYMSEEKSFWMMERILKGEKYKLRDLYTNGMPLVFKYLFIQDRLVKQHLSKLHLHFEKIGIKPMDYALKWLTTRFSEFPTALVIRIFEVFLNEGMKFLFRVSLFLLQLKEKDLLTMNFEEVNMCLRNLPTSPEMENTDFIISESFKVRIKRADIEKICLDYKPIPIPASPTESPSSTSTTLSTASSPSPSTSSRTGLVAPPSPTTAARSKEWESTGSRGSPRSRTTSTGRRKSISEMIFLPKSPNICYSD